ncbi:GNAT family N-acetyltransferase [Thioclava sp. GXIMD4216]|uniref:GNAT family N-acetyltransferase n=1 Tax=Thioclava litoralis TaxID=3076557 RepID=A0ABZ1E2F3_9RHOB|nr:GNAT family N-acetyltransferase [Thioclava sp. FTW29]
MTPAQMAAIHKQCFTTPRPWRAEEFAETLAKKFYFLLHEEQGFLIGRVIAGEAELTTIAVAPAARRQGIARRLMARFDTEMVARKAEIAHLEVALDNHAAHALYLASGWQDSCIRDNYYRHPDGHRSDAVLMMRDYGPDIF